MTGVASFARCIMNGNELLHAHITPLLQLVASTSLWVRPTVIEILSQEDGNTTARWFRNVRRARKSEEVSSYADGNYLDNNSKANIAIKTALGYSIEGLKIEKFHTCHIYDEQGEAYDPLYYCSLPNLVLIPSAIHSLADHFPECKQVLKYRAYELYGFYRDTIPPSKPDGYDQLVWHPFIGSLERAVKSIKKRGSSLQSKSSLV
jgi:hypothetical protein